MENVYCVARKDLEKLAGSPLPEGAFKGPTLEQVLALPQYYIPRPEAEVDPDYKQIIPYQLFCSKERTFVYRRGGGVGEQRLKGRCSVGIGGHINDEDADDGRMTPQAYFAAIDRERHEELICPEGVSSRFLGWINDESDAVGQVHLGAVHCCIFPDTDTVSIRPDGEDIRQVGWLSGSEITGIKGDFEKWSILAVSLL